MTPSLRHRRAEEAAPPEVTWTWKRESSQGIIPVISLCHQKKIFNDIRAVLTAVGGNKLLKQFSNEVSDSDDSAVTPSARPKRTRSSTPSSLSSRDKWRIPHHVPQVFDEAGFVDRVADRVVDRLIEPMVERLSQQLIPQMKQLIEDLSHQSRQSPSQPSPPQPPREVRDQIDASFFAKNHCMESAKADERKKERSYDGRSSSMWKFSTKEGNGLSLGEKKKPAPNGGILNNDPRFGTGVSGGAKSSANRKDAIDSSEPSKWELKANITKKKNEKKKKMKKLRSNEETSDDEESESSSGEEKRKRKKRCRRKRAKYSDSSSSDSDAGGSSRHHRRWQQHQHHSISLPD